MSGSVSVELTLNLVKFVMNKFIFKSKLLPPASELSQIFYCYFKCATCHKSLVQNVKNLN